MCQHCSTQTHSSPEGDRKGVSFTAFQYKQHIKKLKYLANIPTSVSGSECPQIILDHIFSADYSQLTQSTFSTPLVLNSTPQKPYSSGPNLPPQDLGMIISAILSLRYNIPHRDSCILNPSLNLLIKSSSSSSGGNPTTAFHIPQDLSTIFGHLQLKPVIQSYICCPQCFFLNGLTESFTTDQLHCQCHSDPNDHDPPCTQSLGKFINSFEPQTKNTTKIKKYLSQQKSSFINHLKIGFPYFSRWLELWKFCIKINNFEFPKVPPNVKSGMDWSRDASLALEISMNPHSCPFPVHWPSPLMWTGSMHMESQPCWPELDLSCLFVLISPKWNIEARECLCFRNHSWSKGANFPTIESP
ncbi:hypothetical protein O181_082546 [Austropuccinia psidii MF-1]|uniref:Uncharacterized protein n=1 Tax=Austropuccinia psidii MF-1 TaxID=1389203 RepID=A0A9Q3IH18_9BASI|nr:hypothetical protein [Austropuccinia psidii MF-1]